MPEDPGKTVDEIAAEEGPTPAAAGGHGLTGGSAPDPDEGRDAHHGAEPGGQGAPSEPGGYGVREGTGSADPPDLPPGKGDDH
jgi:hypothetical protein